MEEIFSNFWAAAACFVKHSPAKMWKSSDGLWHVVYEIKVG